MHLTLNYAVVKARNEFSRKKRELKWEFMLRNFRVCEPLHAGFDYSLMYTALQYLKLTRAYVDTMDTCCFCEAFQLLSDQCLLS